MTTEANEWSEIQFFHRRESNKHDPKTVPCVPYCWETPHELHTAPIAELMEFAYSNGLPKGSTRCGCVEVQTDAGIWSSHHGGRIIPSKATFTPWD